MIKLSIDNIKPVVFLLAAGGLLWAGAAFTAGKLYKWVDEKGHVQYSDKLPPHLMKNAHQELNEQGVTLKDVIRERTDAEREQSAEESKKHAETIRVTQAEAAKQRLRDKILLDTFTTERDLVLTRDERIGMIDSSLNLAKSNNQALRRQAEESTAQISALEKKGHEVPDNLRKKITGLNSQIKKNDNFLVTKRLERHRLEDQFKLDLIRFRELKSGRGKEEAAPVSALTADENKKENPVVPAPKAGQ